MRRDRAMAGRVGWQTVATPPLPERIPLPVVSPAMLSDRPESTSAARASRDAPEWSADGDPKTRGEGLTTPHPDGTSRPDASYVRSHREVLALSLLVLILAFGLVELPGGRVAVRGLTGYPLPSSCASRSLLGIKCPGCGLTRSFIHLVEGDWRASWRCHRLGGPMAAVVIFQIPCRLLALRRPGRPPIPARWVAAPGAALIALLILNWLADVVTGRLASL
jgi:hypothetical protein